MVRKTKIYELDFHKTLPYFRDHIVCGKTLSAKVLEKIDFNKGSFFTILPSNVLLDKIFDFNHGGIILPLSCGKDDCYTIESSEQGFSRQIITMDRECSEFIEKFCSRHQNNWAVIENYMLDPSSPYVKINNVKMIPFNSDVYYFINKKIL